MSLIAIATEAAYSPGRGAEPWYDDAGLAEALTSRGHKVSILDWRDAAFDPLRFEAVLVSTTWNGCDHAPEFLAWLESCEADGRQRLINSRPVLEEGFFKDRHLPVLAAWFGQAPTPGRAGFIIPSAFYLFDHGRQAAPDLELILTGLDRAKAWTGRDIVLKPVISADGKGLFVFNRTGSELPMDREKREKLVVRDIKTAQTRFARLAADAPRGGAIVQPYMKGVERGEYSLTFFNREFSHAVKKPPMFLADGSERRAAVAEGDLPTGMLGFARQVVERMGRRHGPGGLVRTRIDLFPEPEGPVLCEFESVDPNPNISVLARDWGREAVKPIFRNYALAVEEAVRNRNRRQD